MHRIVRAILGFAIFGGFISLADAFGADAGIEFFETKIRPVLIEHCYTCHSADSKELKGELRLDLKAGWLKGGESGEPAIVPGKPDESPLIRSVRHEDDVSAMPPKQSKLSAAIIDDLVSWVNMGAPDPREGELAATNEKQSWDAIYQERLNWWSLKPVANVEPPVVKNPAWERNEVDRFILDGLEAKGLQPAAEAERHALLRRLSFALTGLPPSAELIERFATDPSPDTYEKVVQTLLDSPHFGERWARHWMDIVHYTDTHGYEWDTPAKNAWMYRDYLIRAFNEDVPYRRMILEQIAGDLIEPRLDPQTGLNESLIGPMALRLGERRHGDSAQTEGTTQEAIANMIDTIGKGFLGTTVACSQCHDHKLDAVAQRDYYAMAGVLMSTRWNVRSLETVDPNGPVIDELRRIKRELRSEVGKVWLASSPGLAEKIKALPADDKAAASFPESIAAFWQRSLKSPVTVDEFAKERERRLTSNQNKLELLADFTRDDGSPGWKWDGWGMKHGLVRDGEIVVADEGDAAVMHILPAGRWSHVWSQRLAGAVRSSLFDPLVPVTFSVEFAAGKLAARSLIVDNAFHSERMKFMNQPLPGWDTVTAGNLDTLEGSVDQMRRLVYLELVTKSLNNYFPPRTGYGGSTAAEEADARSWIGVTKVYAHPKGEPPLDELTRFEPIFADAANAEDWSQKLSGLLSAAIERWSRDECSSEDVKLLNEALQLKWLPNDLQTNPEIARLVAEYRAVEKTIRPERTIGSVDDWHEGRNERIGVRGSYTEFGDEVERGGISLLGGVATRSLPLSSGRLELALSIVDETNPLTARVYVNRVWQYLFGEGLVRTPDDFGHLGQPPTHPELLDYLAARFLAEGWSHKKLVTLLVTSATWRQSSLVDPATFDIDPDNRLWHHLPLRRLEAEAIRDSILAVSGRMDATLYGPPIEPFRTAEDHMKRLLIGPLDGNGRRSIYTEMTLMEPPRFLALFNQPIPRMTTGKRDVTNVPDQALALLNDPFVQAMAKHWSEQLIKDGATTPDQRIRKMFLTAFARPPKTEETARLVKLVERSAKLRNVSVDQLLDSQPSWQDAAHAMFNLKEFIYVQ